MIVRGVSAALLAAGVTVELLCAVGVLVLRGVFVRLHVLSAASSAGAVTIALAVVVRDGLSATAAQAVVVAGLLLIAGPVLTHALAVVARTSVDSPEAEGATGGPP